MNAKTFVDTNVLVYAHDNREEYKQAAAKRILHELAQQKTGVLSMQVLQEFYNTVTRKIAIPLPKDEARGVVEDFAYWCVATTPEDIKRAFQIEDEAGVSFWDALIVAAAVRSGATRILSEDLNDGQVIAGISVMNPFALR